MAEKMVNIKTAPEIFAMSWVDVLKHKGDPEIKILSLPKLTEKLWGLQRKKMLVIAGRTSQAKTSLAMQVAKDVAKQGYRVYYFSLEESEEDLILRLFCNVAGISYSVLLYEPDKYEKQAQEFSEFLKGFPLVIMYKLGVTVRELYQVIEDLPRVDVVIVDYLQCIRKLDNDKVETINDYIVRFRELCVKKDICGILVSQINREAMNEKERRPQIWQLKGSGAIEEHADQVLLTFWDYFYSNKEDRRYNFEVIIGKNKNGPTGKIRLLFYPEYYRFEEQVLDSQAKQAMKVFEGVEA